MIATHDEEIAARLSEIIDLTYLAAAAAADAAANSYY